MVYGRVAVSTFSLSSSSLMTAVFLASLIFRRPSSPVVMVWTFEHPSLRAVFFLLIFLCDKKVLLSGKEVTICLSVLLILIHLKRKVDHSGTAPHYLGLPSLRQAIAVQCDVKISSTVGRNPLKLHSTPVEHCNL